MTRTTWTIGLTLVAAAALQLTLMATGVAGIPPDDRGRPAGVPASIQLSPEPAIISCDGIDASTVTVRVTDSRGRAVPDGTLVHFDAQYGFVDPVEAATQRGEASTQTSLYGYAANFYGETGVEVFVEGGLRASIGIDCGPAGPPCDPVTPHPQSPPCPTPGPCNVPFSPPVHSQSPPCPEPTPTCNIPFSPPVHVMSPPCGTPTPEPCHPASPPCVDLSVMKLDGDPIQPGIQDFVIRDTGATFRVGVHVTQASEIYAAYQWTIEWPVHGLSFGANIAESGTAIGLNLCVDSPVSPSVDPAYDAAHAGGCVGGENDTDFTGEVTTFDFTCETNGVHKINLVAQDVSQGFYSLLINSFGDPIDTVTQGVFIDCAVPQPPIGFGTIRFESYEPVTATVGVPFELSIEAVGVTIPYQGYEWLAQTTDGIDVLDERAATALYDLCSGSSEVSTNQFYGGCIRLGTALTEIHLGEVSVLTLTCESAGTKQIHLAEGNPFQTGLLNFSGTAFGGLDTTIIDVTCVGAEPTATPTSTGLNPFEIPAPTATTAAARSRRALQ